jgi:hypothetical protein
MANTIATTSLVLREVARYFVNSLKGVAAFNRSLSDEYVQPSNGAKVGDTVKVKLPQMWEASTGQALVLQNILDQTVNVILNSQRHVGFGFSSAQATTDLGEIRKNYVSPASATLANAMDAASLNSVYKDIYNSVGTLGTTPAAVLTYLQARVKLLDLSTPPDGLVAVLEPLASATLQDAVKALFHPTSSLTEGWRKGQFASNQLGIETWAEDQNMPRFTSGATTTATPLVNGAGQTGSSVITDGWGSGNTSLKKGDIVTFAGVRSVNPLSKVDTGRLQQFTLTADASDTTGAVTLSITPSIITSGPLQNVTGAPADNAVLTYWGMAAGGSQAATVSPQNLVFHPEAFASVMADLKMPNGGANAERVRDKDLGLSIRYVEQFDITTDQNLNRLDILFGAATIQARMAARVVG